MLIILSVYLSNKKSYIKLLYLILKLSSEFFHHQWKIIFLFYLGKLAGKRLELLTNKTSFASLIYPIFLSLFFFINDKYNTY